MTTEAEALAAASRWAARYALLPGTFARLVTSVTVEQERYGGLRGGGVELCRMVYSPRRRGGNMTDQDLAIVVSFDEPNVAKRNQAANELRGMLDRKLGGQLESRIEKENPDTQDMGATLVLLFGTGAALAIAEGLKAYLAKANSSITIKTRKGTVVLSGDAVRDADAAKIVRELQAAER